MTLVGLTEIDILVGIFSLSFMIISIIIGIKILLKGFSYKHKNFIAVGLTWIFLSTAWWGSAISFFMYLLWDITLPVFWYLFVNNAFTPFAIICWIYSFINIIYPEKYKLVVVILSAISLVYELILLSLLFINPLLVGSVDQIFNSSNELFVIIFLVFSLSVALTTGLIFASKSLKSPDPNVKWKGRFLMAAFISFTLGAIFDVGFEITILILFTARILLIASAFLFYFGFFLPKKFTEKADST